VRRWRKIEAERAAASGSNADTEMQDGLPGGAEAEKPPKGN
jgi:UPF0755 protein